MGSCVCGGAASQGRHASFFTVETHQRFPADRVFLSRSRLPNSGGRRCHVYALLFRETSFCSRKASRAWRHCRQSRHCRHSRQWPNAIEAGYWLPFSTSNEPEFFWKITWAALLATTTYIAAEIQP